MKIRIIFLSIIIGVTACKKEEVAPGSGNKSDGTPDLVETKAGTKIIGRLTIKSQSNNDGLVEGTYMQQVANNKIYFYSMVNAPITGISKQHFYSSSLSEPEIKDYTATDTGTENVDYLFYLEGEPDNEYERLDINGGRMYKNGAGWSLMDRIFYDYTGDGGYVLSVTYFNPVQKKLIGLSPFSELGIYDFTTRTTSYYAPKPFSPPAPIGVTYRSDLLLDEKFSIDNPGHHRIITGTWDYKSNMHGGPVASNDLMFIITEASDTTSQRVTYNGLNATRLLQGDTIVTMKSLGPGVDVSVERGFIRLCQDDNYVWGICYNPNATASILQYDKKLKKLKAIISESSSLYREAPYDNSPYDNPMHLEKVSGKNQLLVCAGAGHLYRIDLDTKTTQDITPKILTVGGYYPTASVAYFYKGKAYIAYGEGADLQRNGEITYYYNTVEIDPGI